MPVPAAPVVDREAVKARYRITDTRDDVQLDQVCAAVDLFVRGLPIVARTEAAGTTDADTWDPRLEAGAMMLAGRLWRRKDSPEGVAVFGADGPVYVQRNDPDVAMMLEVGSWSPPEVG